MPPNRFRRRAAARSASSKPASSTRSRVAQILFGVFVVLCLIAVGWRVLRPILWPKLQHETPKQTSKRMFDDNSFFR